jgi:hypothetical protein
MLKKASVNNSRQSLRAITKGTFKALRAKASKGKPINIDKLRNVSGGKPVTPNFMMGQLKPHTKVRLTKVIHCWRDSRGCDVLMSAMLRPVGKPSKIGP